MDGEKCIGIELVRQDDLLIQVIHGLGRGTFDAGANRRRLHLEGQLIAGFTADGLLAHAFVFAKDALALFHLDSLARRRSQGIAKRRKVAQGVDKAEVGAARALVLGTHVQRFRKVEVLDIHQFLVLVQGEAVAAYPGILEGVCGEHLVDALR